MSQVPPSPFDDLDPAALERRVSEKWATYDQPGLLPAWVAEMDFRLADPIQAVLRRATELNDVGYPTGIRDTGLLDVFAERMERRFGWQVDPRRCEALSEVVQGMYAGLLAYSKPGEGAVVQTAIYPPFLSAVRDTNRQLVENRLIAGTRGWEIDFDALRDAVRGDTRVLMLCNPHNPSGRAFRRDELDALAEVALERDLIVVSDEIHMDLVYDGGHHIPFATLGPELAERTVTLTSATKAFNIPGLRCAIAHFGSQDLQQRFNDAVHPHVRGGIGLLGIHATIAAWRDSEDWLAEARRYLQANRDHLCTRLASDFPEIVCHRPEATYLAWLDCSALDLPKTPGRFFFEQANVALSDGRMFGQGFEKFARLNFATSRGILDQILDRMAAAAQAHRAR